MGISLHPVIYLNVPHGPTQPLSRLPLWMQPATREMEQVMSYRLPSRAVGTTHSSGSHPPGLCDSHCVAICSPSSLVQVLGDLDWNGDIT